MAIIIDHMNPFFLHHSDNPSQVLFTHVLSFNGENYNAWKHAMILALSTKNKIGFIDGTILPPNDFDPQCPLWLRCNNVVASWILNSVCRELTINIVYLSTARSIWLDLETRFKHQDGPRMLQLRRKFASCTQGSSSVNTYYNKIKTLWEQLSEFVPPNDCNCGGSLPLLNHIHSEYVFGFLMGLNKSYSQIRGQILLMNPIPTIEQVFAFFIQEETQCVVGTPSLPAPAPTALTCVVQPSTTAPGPATATSYKKERLLCGHCGILGHVKEKCFKLHGYPPGHKKFKGTPNNVQSIPSTEQYQ